MTIISHAAAGAPLFVVVGATGAQGRSLIDAIAADGTEYRVRGITRDVGKPEAHELRQLGVEVVAGNANDANSVETPFNGADVIFAMTTTDYFSSNGEEEERKRGKMLAGTAKKAGAKVFMWSGLPDHRKLTGGKRALWSFDVKADIVEHARSLGGMRVVDVQPGSFASNYWRFLAPRRTPEGTYILPLAYEEDTRIPICDISADFGRYAMGALNHGVDTVLAASEYVTPVQMAEQYSNVTGRNVTFVLLKDDELYEAVKGAGDKFASTMVAMCAAARETGYYGGADLSESQRVLS